MRRRREIWRRLTHFDTGPVGLGMAVRNTIGVVLPLIAGVALGYPRAGLATTGGAFATSFSDGTDAYPERARRMLTASLIITVAMTIGTLVGPWPLASVLVVAAAGFAAGMALSISQTAGTIATISLVWLIIYAGQGLPPERALVVAPLALLGGLLQTGLSLLLWPLRPYGPERRALSRLYLELAGMARSPEDPSNRMPASEAMSQAGEALRRLGDDDHRVAMRYRSLLSQAERIRLALLTLRTLCARVEGEVPEAAESIRDFIAHSATDLEAIGRVLLGDDRLPEARAELAHLDAATADWHHRLADVPPTPAMADALFQMDAEAGQLRAAVELAAGATPTGATAMAQAERRLPARLRLGSAWATLRANLDLRSVAFRHALRLSIVLAIAEGMVRALHWERAFWIPMTVALVLRPDFATTMSRGVLRIAGELTGLLVATGLFHWLPAGGLTGIVLVAAFVFLARSLGPGHFGIQAVAVSAMVVALLSFRGVLPGLVIFERGRAMLVGGGLALAAYLVWPSTEGYDIGDRLASLVLAFRDYFKEVAARHGSGGPSDADAMERRRSRVRIARSNLDAQVQRWSLEPGTPPGEVEMIRAMAASLLRLAQSIIPLDVGEARVPEPAAFQRFAAHVEVSLTALADEARGRSPDHPLPGLREDVRILVGEGDRQSLVNVQADAIANCINTLAMHMEKWRDVDRAGARSS